MQQVNTYEGQVIPVINNFFIFLFSLYISRAFKEATAYLELRDPL